MRRNGAEELALGLAVLSAMDEREHALGALALGPAVARALLGDLVRCELTHAEAEHRRFRPRVARLRQVCLDQPLGRCRARRDDLRAKEAAELGVRIETARVDGKQIPVRAYRRAWS